MNFVKKNVLALTVLLALFAGDVAAQCGGKTVYVQLPDGWNRTAISILWEGNVISATANVQGDYSVFTFPNASNDKPGKTFAFSMKSNDIDNSNHWIAAGARYDIQGSRPQLEELDGGNASRNQGIACNAFGTSNILYVYPNPADLNQTVVSTEPPDAYNFYFLPPKNDEWTLGTPVLVWANGQKTRLKIDSKNCGWYKITWFNEPVPDGDAWIWLNGEKPAGPDDKLGEKGLGEDPLDWPDGPDGNPTPFNLAQRFNNNPGDLFYNSNDNGEWGPAINGTGRCSYNFGAIIYHTNTSKNLSFSFYDERGREDGITRGIVKSELADGKIQFNASQNTDWTAENFKKAFESTPGTNVKRCFDMPFSRNSTGLWEFDALKLCADGTTNCSSGAIGGFYPPNLMRNQGGENENFKDFTSEYTAMGNRREYKGDMSVTPKKCVNMWCFDRGWYGGNCKKGGDQNSNPGCSPWNSGCADIVEIPDNRKTDPGMTGNLDGLTTKAAIDAVMNNVCYEPLKAAPASTIGNQQGYLYDYDHSVPLGYAGQTTSNVSGLMCFESMPAEFTYEPGQEFFFRGDDDIWVFINNKLVVDLGGNHGPAPGYVKLDTIQGLEVGNKYKINIFFCDRRGPGSNVRITTNMYFSQNSGLFVTDGTGSESKPAKLCMLTGGGGSCKDLTTGGGGTSQELCGGQIRGDVEYFIVNRRGDLDSLLWSPTGPTTGTAHQSCNLSSDGSKLTCWGGVVIDLSQGSAYVNKEGLNGIAGSWTLYARVKDKPEIERVKIASFSTTVNVRMAWGSITNDRDALVTNVCDYTKYNGSGSEGKAVTGERFPVCFIVGEETANGFVINDDGAGFMFNLKTEGFKNQYGDFNANAGLRVYTDSIGDNEIPFGNMNQQQKIPDNGVLVLWVTGDYKQSNSSHDYKINVSGKNDNEVTLHSLLPRLAWTKGPGTSDLPWDGFTAERGWGSKFLANGSPARLEENPQWPDFIWIGESIDLHLRAYNELSGKTCKTCSFSLTPDAVSSDPAETSRGSALVGTPPGLGIVDGEASFAIRGNKPAILPEQMTKFIARNANSDLYIVEWDSLQFKKPPVPVPEHTEIYDEDGDGIGDYMKITYSRGFRRDSLPNMLEVKWDVDSTGWVRLGKATKDADGKYSNKGYTAAENEAFWNDPDHKIILGAGVGTTWANRESTDRSIDNDLEFNVKDTVILKGKFSKNVLTQGDGTVVNWTTFNAKPNDPASLETTTPLTGSIDEKIPAIVVRARYSEKRCSNGTCDDDVVLEFSERVKIDPAGGASNELIKNPIAYKLIDTDGNKAEWGILKDGDVPASINGSSSNWRPSESGDSVLNLTFKRWRNESSKSGTPMPGDSVKFAALAKGYLGFTANVFVDLKGNKPNEEERGRQIEGRKPFTPEKIPIGSIDPNDPDYYVDEIKNTLSDNDFKSSSVPDNLFSNDRPIELLPVRPDWNIKDVQEHFPGTVGMLFNPDISNDISEICGRPYYEGKPCDIKDEHITIYPRAFYHTNLGNFVADNTKYSGDGIKCNDKIFPVGDNGQPSCRASKSQFYVAWDMKDMKGRFVGTGAYVGLYDFRWEVYIPAISTTEKKENIERRVEMHGVKRIKKR
jgi:fibro-slime domain-containing protein